MIGITRKEIFIPVDPTRKTGQLNTVHEIVVTYERIFLNTVVQKCTINAQNSIRPISRERLAYSIF